MEENKGTVIKYSMLNFFMNYHKSLYKADLYNNQWANYEQLKENIIVSHLYFDDDIPFCLWLKTW